MPSTAGMDVSPAARPASTSRRAISRLSQPRSSRCWRSHTPSSLSITLIFPGFWRAVLDYRGDIPGQGVSGNVRDCHRPLPGGSRWSGEEVVGQADLGAVDEGADLVGFQDQRGAGGGGGLVGGAKGAAAAGVFLGFRAVAAVGAAPGLGPSVGAEVGGGHAVADVHGQISLRMVRRVFSVSSVGAAWALMRSRAWT